jgi:hypothetical protein
MREKYEKFLHFFSIQNGTMLAQNKKVQQKRHSSRFPYCFTSTKILTRSRHPGYYNRKFLSGFGRYKVPVVSSQDGVIDDESLVKTRTNICLSDASAVPSYSVIRFKTSKKTANEIGNSSFETPSKTSSASPASSHSEIEKKMQKLFVFFSHYKFVLYVKILLVYSKSIVDFISVIILA